MATSRVEGGHQRLGSASRVGPRPTKPANPELCTPQSSVPLRPSGGVRTNYRALRRVGEYFHTTASTLMLIINLRFMIQHPLYLWYNGKLDLEVGLGVLGRGLPVPVFTPPRCLQIKKKRPVNRRPNLNTGAPGVGGWARKERAPGASPPHLA